jgi:hypothetical protein
MTRLATSLTPVRGTLLVGLCCAVIGWVVADLPGAVAGVLGALLVAGFFATARVPVLLADQAGLRAGSGVVLLLLTFVLRWMLVLALLVLAVVSDLVHARTLGLTVIACGLAWSLLQLAVVLGRARRT